LSFNETCKCGKPATLVVKYHDKEIKEAYCDEHIPHGRFAEHEKVEWVFKD
jgi:hypothetical protein